MKKLNEFIWETHGIHAGTEQDHIIKLHDRLTYQYNTKKITLEEVRFAIRNLGLKI